MHGLLNRSLESFLRHTYGHDFWRAVSEATDLGFDSFEPMLHYDDDILQTLVDAASARLEKPRDALLEDFGTYLITDPHAERVRRLLRFGGVDYLDFLHSLDDLPGRARLAVPDLNLPRLELVELGGGEFTVTCGTAPDGFGHVMLGALRALADDYGALAFLEYQGGSGGRESLLVRLLDPRFAEGRDFVLAARAG